MAENPSDSSSSLYDEDILKALRAATPDQSTTGVDPLDLIARLKELPYKKPAAAPLPPTSIRYVGDYELLDQIGHGGMGAVYRAKQLTLQRDVALKMLLGGQFASADARARFRREAEAVARLDHPHILPIYETGEYEDQPYFSMKLVENGNLSQARNDWCLETKLPSAELRRRQRSAAQLLRQLAAAVHHAHQHGIMHRDIKPSNVLLDASDVPYLSDFGLAKETESEAGLTISGAIIGTPSYMSPEQASGAKHITTAADIYGLGAILYELLTGRPPFNSESTAKTLRMVIDDELISPRTIERRVDRDLETICLKCLAKRPTDRYESASELENDLNRYLKGEPILARPISRIERIWKWVKRRPTAASLSILSIVSILLFIVVLIHSRAAIQAAQQTTEKALDETRKSLDRERHSGYLRTVALAYQVLQQGDVRHAAHLLAGCDESERGWEWHFLNRKSKQALRELKSSDPFLFDLKYSPDGKWLVALTLDRKANRAALERWDTTTWNSAGRIVDEQATVDSENPWRFWPCLTFSPDGREVAYTAYIPNSDNSSRSVEPTGVVRRFLTKNWKRLDNATEPLTGRYYVGVMYPKDGTCLGVSKPTVQHETRHEKVKFLLHDLDRSDVLAEFMNEQRMTNPSLSPDETKILFTGGYLLVFDRTTGKPKHEVHYNRATGDACWMPDGDKVFAVDLNGRAFLTEFATSDDQSRNILAFQAHTNYARKCILVNDAKQFATVGHDGMVHLWNASNGKETASLNFGGRLIALTARSGTEQMAFADESGQIGIWDSSEKGVLREGQASTGQFVDLSSATSDGMLVASLDAGDSATLWDLHAGKARNSIAMFEPSHPGFDQLDALCISLTSDGKLIAGSLGDDDKEDRRGCKLKVWNTETGEMLESVQQDGDAAKVIVWDNVAKMLVGMNQSSLTAWTWPGLKIAWQRTSPEGTYKSIVIRPGSRELAAARRDKQRSWIDWIDLDSGKVAYSHELSISGVHNLSFSWSGEHLAAAGYGEDRRTTNCVVLIELRDRTETRHLVGGQDGVVRMAFTPKNERLVTSCRDGNVLVWDVESSAEILNLRGEQTNIYNFALSRQGKLIAAQFQGPGLFVLDGSEANTNRSRN